MTMTVTQAVLVAGVTILVTVVVQKLCKFYYQLTHLPPGPFPLPVIGNLLTFRKNVLTHEVMLQLAKEHGSVYTLFMGTDPTIIVTDPRLGLEVMRKHTFAGRPRFNVTDYYYKDNSIDIIFGDFSKEWEALRKVGHLAARKFAVSSALNGIVLDAVDHLIESAGSEPFDSEVHLNNMMITILARTAFGKKYAVNDPDFVEWKNLLDFVNETMTDIMAVEYVPPLKIFYRKTMKKLADVCDMEAAYTRREYEAATERFVDGKIETFCDAIVAAKKEAEQEESSILKYLTTENMVNAINNLFEAGVDTTKITTQWCFLFMAIYPLLQDEIRKEVEEVVGNERPSIEHKPLCHKLNAFVSEVMRFRPIVATGVPHKATVDTEIGGVKVRKNTTVMVPLVALMRDPESWGDPERFRPSRFLDSDGNHVPKPNNCFIPFSDGRRSCPGNKLAQNNLFLILSRFLQRTQYIDVFGGVEKMDISGDPEKTNGWNPYNFSLILTLK